MPPEPLLADPGTPAPGQARLRLRDATDADHERVDTAFAHFDLATAKGYRAFLTAQYACVAPLEAALTAAGAGTVLPDWPARHRAPLLAADLADLGDVARAGDSRLSLQSPGALLGAIYVLEGSRFGGAVVARRLTPGAPARFLGAKAQPQAWRKLLASLDHHLTTPREMQAAITAARAVFCAFETAALRQEPGLG